MKHKKIQKRFLLYIDGDLNVAEKLIIDHHLNECSSCKKHFEELANIWNEERTLEQPLPSPALWYKLKNRMDKEAEKPIPLRVIVGKAKLLLNTAITVVVVVFAIFIGSRFGSLLNPQKTGENITYAQSENNRDEFGMSYFDAVPPGSLAKDVFIPEGWIPITSANDGGLQK